MRPWLRVLIPALSLVFSAIGVALLWLEVGWAATLGVFLCLWGHNLERHAP